ncbi:competence protein CoiA [Aquibacillus kalidii]|uniref:competence protein CoiA n=1 Tax=Aquibacillus kalidii TaxID=2762597 RepID=UPI0016489BFF|nr:competence protein CoiA family protein [Aquibacillus kalidii]
MKMLQAKNQKGIVQSLVSLTKHEIEDCRKRNSYFCPICEERLLIKAGDKMIAHFAHQSKSRCPESLHGEGEYHEKGKLELYNWLRKQGLQVQLEAYLPEIKQRPDILLTIGNKKIAIEYQCAKIPRAVFLARNKGYQKLGIHPIWILGGNKLSRKGKSSLYINSSDQIFLHQFATYTPLTIYFFCPNVQQFAIVQHVYLTGRKCAYGQFYFSILGKLRFTDLFTSYPLDSKVFTEFWTNEKLLLRNRPLVSRSRQERQWKQWLYLNHFYQSTLPSIIHLPIQSQWRMKSPPWVWQSRLWYYAVFEKKTVFLDQCMLLLKQHIQTPQLFPLIKLTPNPIEEYLNLLTKLKYLQRRAPNTYEVIKQPRTYKQVESVLSEDKCILNELLFYERYYE